MAYPSAGTCSLMVRQHVAGRCDWDGELLPKGRRRWCSKACSDEYHAAHDWKTARKTRVQKDAGLCQSCGVQTVDGGDPRWRKHPSAPVEPQWDQRAFQADPVGYRAAHRTSRTDYGKAWKRFYAEFVLPLTAEVNHVDPRVGSGYGFGCWNHQDNLETLCHRCHVRVTTQQRKDRRAEQAARVVEEMRPGGDERQVEEGDAGYTGLRLVHE